MNDKPNNDQLSMQHSISSPRLCLAVAVSLALVAGCGTPPRTNVSQFSVLTTLQLRAVELGAGGNRNQLAHLDRYFETPVTNYPSVQQRTDKFLDDYQFATAARQKSTLDFFLEVMAASPLGKPSGSTGTKIAPDNKSEDPMQNALIAAINAQTNLALADSPFDMLDRVSDYYGAYLLKFLRLQGDSRSADTDALVARWRQDLARKGITNAPGSHPSHRLLFLLTQTHVDPGTRANNMTGVRVRLTDMATNPVPVLRLHPSRTYDLDSVALEDQREIKVEIKGEGQVNETITLAGAKKSSTTEETLRRFNSRRDKVSSYAEAAEGIIGWNFYPSNLNLERKNAIWLFVSYLIGAPRPQVVKARLEGGGRDAFALVLVPWGAKQLRAEVQSLHAAMRVEGHGYRGPTHADKSWSKPIVIDLPPASEWEALAATPGLTEASEISPQGLAGGQRSPNRQRSTVPASTISTAPTE
jgi:hypothetical protein